MNKEHQSIKTGVLVRVLLYSKFSFWEVYRQIYGRKFSFTAAPVKRELQPYIRQYTSPNENFEYGYPHSNALLNFSLVLECCKSYKAACRPRKCTISDKISQDILSHFRCYPMSGQVTKSSALKIIL